MLSAELAIILMVFLLGIKHGFEPDHLAIIDGMTRSTSASTNQPLSKYVGLLFSFGHGGVIVLISFFIGIEAQAITIPSWFVGLGTWISIVSLVFIGVLNLYMTFRKKSGEAALFTPKNYVLGKLTRFNTPAASFWSPICVGILFSLSFDTLSQTMAFSLSAYTLAGRLFPVVLGVIFMLSMMMTDGLNGYIVARVLRRADERSIRISQGLGLFIGVASLMIAAYYLVNYF